MPTPVLAVVDDYQPFLEYLATFLRMRRYEVRAYSSGRQILDAVDAGDVPDLVLLDLDVMMPGMDGLDTLHTLKARTPSVPVIMLSARNQTSTVVEAVRLGALDYLVKPGDPEGSRRSRWRWRSGMRWSGSSGSRRCRAARDAARRPGHARTHGAAGSGRRPGLSE